MPHKINNKLTSVRDLDINGPEDLKNFIIMKDGSLMHIDEWTSIPAPGTSKTEDADFEIIEPKQLPPNDTNRRKA